MKTLSFVKQAMAVALLISAVNASAMDYAQAFGAKVVSLAEQPARLTGKAFEYVPYWRKRAMKPTPQVDENGKYIGSDNKTYDATEAMPNSVRPLMTAGAPAKFLFVADAVSKRFAASKLGIYLQKDENVKARSAALVTTSLVIVAGVSYGIYKAYKALTGKAVVADQDQAQEDAQPEVEATVVEETTSEVEAPAKIVRKQRVV